MNIIIITILINSFSIDKKLKKKKKIEILILKFAKKVRNINCLL